ncbi:hypothetical protein V6N12_070176 [Hibiscus sabdariffa]|uniref:Uncharacterized protein n=1 Tax=Hibiscus sabdariffa TaxID=183260 RepID=A0ABR2FG10_9ROSI
MHGMRSVGRHMVVFAFTHTSVNNRAGLGHGALREEAKTGEDNNRHQTSNNSMRQSLHVCLEQGTPDAFHMISMACPSTQREVSH